MKLADILPIENIKIPLTGKTKEEIITELVDIATASNPNIDKKVVLRSILERERTMSTGIGHGIAIPHGRTKGVKDIIAALGIVHNGIDFDAIDSQPAFLFFLLAAPEGETGQHLRCLSLISRLLNRDSFRKQLIECRSPKEVFRIVDDAEQKTL